MKLTKDDIRKNPIAAALQLTHEHAQSMDPKRTRKAIEAGRNTIALLQMTRGQLIGVEREAGDVIKTKINEIQARIEGLEHRLVPDLASFKIFDLKPLTWRDAHGMPLLAVFSIDQARCTLEVRPRRHTQSRYDHSMSPDVPEDMEACYADVMQRLGKVAKEKKKNVKITAVFDGVLPDDVRHQINEARPLFRGMFIIAEVSNWTYKESKPAPVKRVDPLVIGWDGHFYRLVAAFDLSPIEKLIKDRIDSLKSS